MSGYTVLACLFAMVRLTTQTTWPSYEATQTLPLCEENNLLDELKFMEPVSPTKLSSYYSAKGDGAFVWFCPFINNYESYYLRVHSCAFGKGEDCLMTTESFNGEILQMNDCQNEISFTNFRQRVFTCMPWEVDPNLKRSQNPQPWSADVGDSTFDLRIKTGMRHFRTQFQDKFKPVWQWWETPHKTQDATVSSCASSEDDIHFTNEACWHSDSAVVFLKPRYKFKTISSDRKQLCVLSNTVVGTDVLSYNTDALTYIPQPTTIQKKFTHCRWWGKKMEWYHYVAWWSSFTARNEWHAKEIQFLDYRTTTHSNKCMDSVTEPCVDNVFSFYAKECVWVRKVSAKNPYSLSEMLLSVETEDKESFETYGDSMYVMNLANRNIEVVVSSSNMQGWEKWNGVAKRLDPRTARLYFTEKPNFSCNGCQSTPNAVQAWSSTVRKAPCGVPQQCDTCGAWQRVDEPGTWSDCTPSFAERRCTACPDHHVRSGANEKLCEACPPLTPMRRKGQTSCTVCEHTQWFDASSTAGCVYFMSVADGLSFSGTTRFDKAYVDEYRPAGSTRLPEAVPALHYRNLVSDSNAWNASTSAEMCPPVSFGVVNMSVTGNFARNVHGRQMKFRRWCGHAEILKSDNAVMQSLDCGSRRPDLPTSISELVAFSVGVYVLTKERRLVSNRMAEVKLTMLSDGFSCYYELRREGRAEDCRYCTGTMYTQGCGPTYYKELDTPAVAGPGTCVACDEQCSVTLFPNHFFAVTQFSCWSNGTERVRGSSGFGSIKLIAQAMSTSMNYWYKPAACMPCAKVSDARVPQIVTRCGNKAWFETWNPTVKTLDEIQVQRPAKRFCCAMDFGTSVGTRCEDTESALLMTTTTPRCEKVVPDLQTEYMNYCPPGWFLDKNAPGCSGILTEWKNTCCKECEMCSGSGRIKTDKYETCSGGTDYDMQLAGCVTTCAEKNYEVDGTCVACESCA